MFKRHLFFYMIFFYSQSSFGAACQPVDYKSYNQFGPYSFYDKKNHLNGVDGRRTESNITIVTNYHFTPPVKALKKGQTGYELYSDLDYTLRALPNHPEALDTVSRFEIKRNKLKSYAKKQSAMPYSADCYFQRAIKVFGNNQAQTWMLWGLHQYRLKKYNKAIEYYKKAQNLKLTGAELDYYMGLSYFKLKDYENAQHYADAAYEKGYALPGLKYMLKKVKPKKNKSTG
jgi:tetratricopeptide (TPR) repeat protein